MPLGVEEVLKKIRHIIREEMNNAGALEVTMPVVQPRSIWEESGRAPETYVPPLARFSDRRDRDMVLAPTHEETVSIMGRYGITSYRDMPLRHVPDPNQVQGRDEIPRWIIKSSRIRNEGRLLVRC